MKIGFTGSADRHGATLPLVPTRIRPAVALAVTFALNALVWAIAIAMLGGKPPLRNVIAEYFSTTALLIMSTNLLLVTRARPFEDTFGGLDKVFRSHRFNGVTVCCLIVAHFLIVPKPRGWLNSSPIGLIAFTLILFSILAAIAPRSPWRRLVPLRYQDWKLGHRFMGLFVAVVVVHSLGVHPFSAGLPLVRMWVYGVATLGLLAYVFRETIEPWLLQRHRYTVGEPRHVAPDVLEISLAPLARPIDYRAGQFAFVRFKGGPSREQHPFTISAPPSGGPLRFSVKGSGDYTRALQTHLAAGSLARIEGPYGRFDYRSEGDRQVWVAGGVGITPFLAFLPTLDNTREVHLFWSVRSRAEAPYLDEIERAVAAAGNGVHFTLHESATAGHADLARLGLARPGELGAFVCGPVPMRDAMVAQLRLLGVERDRIHYEEFTLR